MLARSAAVASAFIASVHSILLAKDGAAQEEELHESMAHFHDEHDADASEERANESWCGGDKTDLTKCAEDQETPKRAINGSACK